MSGRRRERVFPDKPKPPVQRSPVLEVIDLGWEHILHNINFSVGKGEIVGLGGLDGQGQGELLLALFGLLRSLRGEILIEGERKNISSPASAASAGISLALIPEDRKTQGLIVSMSVGDNATLATLDQYARGGLIDAKRERTAVERIIEQMNVRTRSGRNTTRKLNGGNQNN